MTDGRLWGAHFSEEPDAAAWALGRSVGFDLRLWPYDLAASRAHAQQLLAAGLLSADQHEAILDALDVVEAELADGSFEVEDSDEDLHGAIERRLLQLAGDSGGRLRAGRSRNDQIASHLRAYCKDAARRIAGDIRGLQRALADQAERAVDWVAPGYTHLQRAQPVTLAHHLLAHAWALDRDAERFGDAVERMDVSTLGAGALAGATLGLDPQAYADALGFARVADNSMDAVAARDFAIELLAAAAILGSNLSRLCEEVVLWTSAEFGWARVGDAFSTGSSIMPQKRNPDVAELVRGKTGRLIGNLTALLVATKGLPLAYNRDLQEDKEPVFDTVDTLQLALPAVAGMVRSLTFDRERLAAAAGGGFALATDLAEELVRRGVAFRDAHERVGRFVAGCGASGAQVTPQTVVAALPELADADVAALLDPARAVAARASSLGPAPERTRDQVARLRLRLSD